MDTLLIEITNQKAIGLLHELEELNLIRVIKQTIESRSTRLYDQTSSSLVNDGAINNNEWWKNKQFVAELDESYKAMESGEDKGITMEELKRSIEKLRIEGDEK